MLKQIVHFIFQIISWYLQITCLRHIHPNIVIVRHDPVPLSHLFTYNSVTQSWCDWNYYLYFNTLYQFCVLKVVMKMKFLLLQSGENVQKSHVNKITSICIRLNFTGMSGGSFSTSLPYTHFVLHHTCHYFLLKIEKDKNMITNTTLSNFILYIILKSEIYNDINNSTFIF